MLRFEQLDSKQDLSELLTPKKKIFSLINEVDSSMLKLHKTLPSSKDIEALANEFFKNKAQIKIFKTTSGNINLESLKTKLTAIKNMKVDDLDFI